jgi:hypothetical protein
MFTAQSVEGKDIVRLDNIVQISVPSAVVVAPTNNLTASCQVSSDELPGVGTIGDVYGNTDGAIRTITRRAIVGAGFVGALGWLLPQKLFGENIVLQTRARATESIKNDFEADLYVHPGNRPDITSIVVAWVEHPAGRGSGQSDATQVRIHAGSEIWSIDLADGNDTRELRWQADGRRLFTGSFRQWATGVEGARRVVTAEVPTERISGIGVIRRQRDTMHTQTRLAVKSIEL